MIRSAALRRACLSALLLTACDLFDSGRTAGGSTDTGNTIVAVRGTVVEGPDAPAGAADLFLRRKDYLVPIPALGKSSAAGRDLFDTATDDAGAFRLDSLDPGAYRLELRRGNGLGGIQDFTVSPAKNALELPGRALGRMAKVGGKVLLRPEALRGFVQVYGMSRLMPINTANGRWDILLPAGDFDLRFIDPEGGRATVKTQSVSLAAGDSVDLGSLDLRDPSAAYPEWTHARRLWINTTSSGASMPRDVYDFPLLVRLDSGMIDFAQAAPGGADLRFSKAGGKVALAYEIERWDAARKQAEVWVRMDTVFGDAGNQYIQMHWGNANAKDSSRGPAVFDTALGFAGVWHLAEGSNFPGFTGYLDATANANRGQGSNISDTTVGPGAIGLGQRLDGNGAYIKMQDHPSLDLGTGDFCVTLWARPDAFQHNRQMISKRESEAGDYEMQMRADGHVDSYTGEAGGSRKLTSRQSLPAGEWRLVAMRRSGTQVGFYVNGVLDTSATLAKAFDLDNASELFIGHDAQNLSEDWQGGIDEVRVARKAMSEDWLRLSYLNQAAGSQLVSPFRP